MNYLTLATIKKHLRLPGSLEDDILTTYGEAAEAMVMNVCNTTYNEMLAAYTTIPAPIVQATLMLVDLSYQQRSPVSPTNLYTVPYTFDFLVKPYMILTYPTED